MNYRINYENWWHQIDGGVLEILRKIWIPIGYPGFAGFESAERERRLDKTFGRGGWRIRHYVRGKMVSKKEALVEYEMSYRVYLRNNPYMVRFLTIYCGNVFDYDISNVYDADYDHPHAPASHYQDISVRRVISELVDDKEWQDEANIKILPTPEEEADLVNLSNGRTYCVPRARGFSGNYIMQIRGPELPGFFLNPALVPIYDPLLLYVHPTMKEWFNDEGYRHLSVEAFWQYSKVLEVRYDRFLDLKGNRKNPIR